MLENLLGKVDRLIVGGGIANTFLAAAGITVGKSLHEADMIDIARTAARRGRTRRGAQIPLPTDVVVAREFSATARGRRASRSSQVGAGRDDPRHRAGHRGEVRGARCEGAGTIVWNGPVGVFEFDQFGEGTRVLAQAVARSPAFSIAGGGDTLAAIEKYGVERGHLVHLDGGGAFLEFLEGKKLPAVEMLEQRAARLSGATSRAQSHRLADRLLARHPHACSRYYPASSSLSARSARPRIPLPDVRRTKIVATLGPATDAPGVLEDVIRRGADVVRVNFSHGEAGGPRASAWTGARRAAAAVGKHVAVLGDLQGPKIRIERFAGGRAVLAEGEPFALDPTLEPHDGTDRAVGMTYPTCRRTWRPATS